ncbi:MipA/OmpV family protein [Stakelama saccharophila]|uniref:MipA/OmpV family protein n=1 Tax=Stakelama saccharophila TaxID=3075605 RepID=A0ABZ0B8T2_9SPHN|nr:MipA/OmpV family protein [Stakelama sp. W311]WNO53826.1 MipA/OmpV family protein [Stakelama sp. W311]
MYLRNPIALATLSLSIVAALPAAAQSSTEAPDLRGDRVTIGAGVASLPDYEGSDDSQIAPLGVVIGQVSGIEFWTRGTDLYVDLIPDAPGPGTHFEAGPIAGVNLNRTGKVDDPQVAALGKLDTAVEVGGFVGISRQGVLTSDYDRLSARIAVTADVAGAHDSYVVSPQVAYSTPLSRQTYVSLNLSADYVGKGYGRTYYDVTPAGSAASGLSPYAVAGSGFKSVTAGLFGIQSLSGDLLHGLGLGAGVAYTRILGDYADSPIVADAGSADQWLAAVGLSYTF